MSDTKKRKSEDNRDSDDRPMHDAATSSSSKRGKKASKPGGLKPDNPFIRNQVTNAEFLQSLVFERFGDTCCGANPGAIAINLWEVNRELEKVKSKHEPSIGDVYCVGNNESAQLGMSQVEGQPSSKFLLCGDLVGSEIVHVETGSQSNYALSRDGKVFDWGNSDMGALGRRTDMEADPDVERKPTQITGFNPSKSAIVRVPASNEDSSILQVAAGTTHGIALSASGAVYGWGACVNDNKPWRPMPPKDFPDNDSTATELYKGKAPRGFREEARHLDQMPQKVDAITAGQSMSAAILADGTLVTWGLDTCGELGRGITKDARNTFMHAGTDEEKAERESIVLQQFMTPKPVVYSPMLSKHTVLDVSCGQSHMMVVVRPAGVYATQVYGAGLNQYGQLGLGNVENCDVLTLLPDSKDKYIVEVAAGQHHSMFLDISGSYIYTCGRSDCGQLGITDQAPPAGDMRTSMQMVAFDSNEDLEFKSIAAGEDHSLAVTKTGKLYSWGFADEGQLGHKEGMYQPRPTLVTKFGKGEQVVVLEAAGGAQHTMILCQRRV